MKKTTKRTLFAVLIALVVLSLGSLVALTAQQEGTSYVITTVDCPHCPWKDKDVFNYLGDEDYDDYDHVPIGTEVATIPYEVLCGDYGEYGSIGSGGHYTIFTDHVYWVQ